MIKLSRAVQAISDDTALSMILRSPGVMMEIHRYEGIEKTVNLSEILFNAYIRDMQSIADHTGQELPAAVRDIVSRKDALKALLRAKFERSNMDIKAQFDFKPRDIVEHIPAAWSDKYIIRVVEVKGNKLLIRQEAKDGSEITSKYWFPAGEFELADSRVTAQLKESQMEKEVPVKIAPVDEKALEKGKVVPKEENNDLKEKKPGLGNTQPIAGDEDSEAVEDTSLSEDSKANAERIDTLRGDVEGLKNSLKDTLASSYKMVLTEEQLKELTSKILSVIASAVTDITVERVEEIAGSILHVDKEVKK